MAPRASFVLITMVVAGVSLFWLSGFALFSSTWLAHSGHGHTLLVGSGASSDVPAAVLEQPDGDDVSAVPTSAVTCNEFGELIDCGYGGITEDACVQRGCCWSPGRSVWCHLPNDPNLDDTAKVPRSPGPYRILKGEPVVFPITVVMIEYNSPRSLRHTLNTYARKGFFEMIDEVILYIQEITPEKEKEFSHYPIKIIGNKGNTMVAGALRELVNVAKNDHILLLEKDFALLETQRNIHWQLSTGLEMLQSERANVVRYRHRFEEGDPNWAYILYAGKEDEVFKNQPNLLCNFYHWIPRIDQRFPGKIWRCNNDPLFYCAKSFYCNWTNNPSLFLKSWFKQNIEPLLTEDLGRGNAANHGLEGKTNWDYSVWNDRNFTIAFGEGLFQHRELDQ